MKSNTAKLAANKQNATKSTGPRTPTGKSISSANATKHGLLAKQAVIPGEDVGDYEELRLDVQTELRPVGSVEASLVDRVVGLLWRLRRASVVEVGIFETEMEELASTRNLFGQPSLSQAGMAAMAHTRQGNNSDAFSRLSRYEAQLDRMLYRAIHELQRLQARRGGLLVPLATAIDVSISSD